MPPAKQPPAIMSSANCDFRGYRTISQHLNDLKKENFSLKLRIYFLEERIQQKYEESSEDVLKREAELAHGEAERMTSLVDSESQHRLDLERELAVKTEECRELLLRCGQQAQKDRCKKKLSRDTVRQI
ncbi:hypothetical protein CRUP_001555 [Coryphaenoides rupestris]|nr:hypothetical protein CRUP_001555 [Coryphaenoides rupestris]